MTVELPTAAEIESGLLRVQQYDDDPWWSHAAGVIHALVADLERSRREVAELTERHADACRIAGDLQEALNAERAEVARLRSTHSEIDQCAK